MSNFFSKPYLAHIQLQSLYNHSKALLDGLEGDNTNPSNLELIHSTYAEFIYERYLTGNESFDLSNEQLVKDFYTVLLREFSQSQNSDNIDAEHLNLFSQLLAEGNQLLDKVAAVGASRPQQDALPVLASIKRIVMDEIPQIVNQFALGVISSEATLIAFNDTLYQNHILVGEDVNSFGNRSISITSPADSINEMTQDGLDFLVELSQPAPNQGLTILYSLSGTATLGEDYEIDGNTLREIYIAPGSTEGIINISMVSEKRLRKGNC